MTYADAQPLARALANKLRAISGGPGELPRCDKSHPLTFETIKLSETWAGAIRQGYANTAVPQPELDLLDSIAVQCVSEGI